MKEKVVEIEILILQSPEVIFHSLTDPDVVKMWWRSPDFYQVSEFRLDPIQGGEWHMNAVDYDQKSFQVQGKVVAYDRPRTLAFTWNASFHAMATTTVRITLSPVPEGTVLRLVHSGFDRDSTGYEPHLYGWPHVLKWLARYIQETAVDYTPGDIAKLIDHALLNPILTVNQLEQGIQIALKHNVASVCIIPFYLKRCAQILKGSNVKASTTIGFPHGAHATAVKIAEAIQALNDGGEELDFVININQALSGNWDDVRADIKAVIDVTHDRGKKVKIIFENCYLNDDQKIRLCAICGELNADWVKTSTGFGTGGATLADVKLMRRHSPSHVQVKAAGGIRDLDTLLAFRAIGVTRIGCSRTAEILEECKRRQGSLRRRT